MCQESPKEIEKEKEAKVAMEIGDQCQVLAKEMRQEEVPRFHWIHG